MKMGLLNNIIQFFSRSADLIEEGVHTKKEMIDAVDPRTGKPVIIEPGDIVSKEKNKFHKYTVDKTVRERLVNDGFSDKDIPKHVDDITNSYNEWDDMLKNWSSH